MRPVAVWVGGARGTFSGTFRHDSGVEDNYGRGNRPCRALKVGLSSYYTDEVSWRLNQSPYFEQQLLCRVWVKDKSDGKTLMTAMVRRLTDHGEPTVLNKDYIDVGPDYDLNGIGMDFVACATENMVEFWSDHALVQYLLHQSRARKEIESRIGGTSIRSRVAMVRR